MDLYAANNLPIYPKCCHSRKPYLPFQCTSQLSPRDVKEFHTAFYKNKQKKEQGMFILSHCDSKDPKRHRKRKDTNNRLKSCITSYQVKTCDGLMISVCRQTFQDIL
ncbi:hypothetical protein ABEB36_012637 [Hypothenemus hampei]|uniref:Uncharacterized protein n=1 Tax=Hypothenemus hampei TaxID=57062 RepID=A0ABD1EC24_HYPHA